ncbi:hypothetical protein G9A89_005793 [Geosiphon pyriformis]|nr:hypothetical protein G9A89_005793 [Geosiphon pyriformis]
MVQSTIVDSETWTAFEKLLLAQAVYKFGDDNWLAVSRTMKQHPMIERPSDFFSQKTCSNKYRLLIEPLELEAEAEKYVTFTFDNWVSLSRPCLVLAVSAITPLISKMMVLIDTYILATSKDPDFLYFNHSLLKYGICSDRDLNGWDIHTPRMPVAAKLARQLYQERIQELKALIKVEEQNFRVVVTEIDEIRSGKLDDKLKEILKENQQLKEEESQKGGTSNGVGILPMIKEQEEGTLKTVPFKDEKLSEENKNRIEAQFSVFDSTIQLKASTSTIDNEEGSQVSGSLSPILSAEPKDTIMNVEPLTNNQEEKKGLESSSTKFPSIEVFSEIIVPDHVVDHIKNEPDNVMPISGSETLDDGSISIAADDTFTNNIRDILPVSKNAESRNLDVETFKVKNEPKDDSESLYDETQISEEITMLTPTKVVDNRSARLLPVYPLVPYTSDEEEDVGTSNIEVTSSNNGISSSQNAIELTFATTPLINVTLTSPNENCTTIEEASEADASLAHALSQTDDFVKRSAAVLPTTDISEIDRDIVEKIKEVLIEEVEKDKNAESIVTATTDSEITSPIPSYPTEHQPIVDNREKIQPVVTIVIDPMDKPEISKESNQKDHMSLEENLFSLEKNLFLQASNMPKLTLESLKQYFQEEPLSLKGIGNESITSAIRARDEIPDLKMKWPNERLKAIPHTVSQINELNKADDNVKTCEEIKDSQNSNNQTIQNEISIEREPLKHEFVKRLLSPITISDLDTPQTIGGEAGEGEDDVMQIDQTVNEVELIIREVQEKPQQTPFNESFQKDPAKVGKDQQMVKKENGTDIGESEISPITYNNFSNTEKPIYPKESFQTAEDKSYLKLHKNINATSPPIVTQLANEKSQQELLVKEEFSDNDVNMVDVDDTSKQQQGLDSQTIENDRLLITIPENSVSGQGPELSYEIKEFKTPFQLNTLNIAPLESRKSPSFESNELALERIESRSMVSTEQVILDEPIVIESPYERKDSLMIKNDSANPMEFKKKILSSESTEQFNHFESKEPTTPIELKDPGTSPCESKGIISPVESKEPSSPVSSFKEPITPAGVSAIASTPSADVTISPHSFSEVAQTPSAEASENASYVDKRHKTWQRLVNMLLQEFNNHRFAGLFQTPIREVDAPGYYNIVKHPMDLKTIKKNVREGKVDDTDKFQRDIMLMFMNALVYNRESTDVHKMAGKMKEYVEKMILDFKSSENSRGGYETTTRRKSMASIDGSFPWQRSRSVQKRLEPHDRRYSQYRFSTHLAPVVTHANILEKTRGAPQINAGLPDQRFIDRMSTPRNISPSRDGLKFFNQARLGENISIPQFSRGISTSTNPIKDIKTLYTEKPPEAPTQSYLAIASQLSEKKESSDRKLIILDLNGTLLYRKYPNRIFARPHLHEFLDYIFAHFEVMVWSSAQPRNVRIMVEYVFSPQYIKKLIDVWTRDDFGLSEKEYNQKSLTLKDLRKVWGGLNKSEHGRNKRPRCWDQTNTLLIDDSDLKAQLQPYNAIHLSEYGEILQESGHDRELKDILPYLGRLRYESNVSSYIKSNPYKKYLASWRLHNESRIPESQRQSHDLSSNPATARVLSPRNSIEFRQNKHSANPAVRRYHTERRYSGRQYQHKNWDRYQCEPFERRVNEDYTQSYRDYHRRYETLHYTRIPFRYNDESRKYSNRS